ncbi:MAG: endoribonuclease MazF [Candidatus Obscuribacterales bacterium]|nr:endoribonuclease MazF [Candidatus Obscuribacterales bacterium]
MVGSKTGAYVPASGDIVWLEFDPQTGHEQAGRRPALIISPQPYNGATSLAIMCPITSKIKGYPFEVTLPSNRKISGAVLADQIKSLDWKSRRAKFIDTAPSEVMAEVLAKIRTLLPN